MIIGISGYTGSGKSKVAAYLQEKNPTFPLIDADKIARRLMLENAQLISKVGSEFGVVEDEKINFAKLGQIVFASVENIKRLNAITFPFIVSAIHDILEENTCVIIDAPLLPLVLPHIGDCKIKIWVESDVDRRVERLKNRTGLKEVQIKNRIDRQMELMPKPTTDDWLFIENNGSLSDLFEKTDALFAKLQ